MTANKVEAQLRARTSRLRTWVSGMSLEELYTELDLQSWALAESRQDAEDGVPGADVGVLLAESAVEVVADEINRRARVRHRPEAPAWDAGRDTGDLIQRARELRERVDLRDFARDHLSLDVVARGSRSWMRCPTGTHADKTPSCTVDARRWYCHACHTGGDVYDLIDKTGRAHLLGGAVAMVADIAGERVAS